MSDITMVGRITAQVRLCESLHANKAEIHKALSVIFDKLTQEMLDTSFNTFDIAVFMNQENSLIEGEVVRVRSLTVNCHGRDTVKAYQ